MPVIMEVSKPLDGNRVEVHANYNGISQKNFSVEKDKAEKYYVDTFEQKILDAAKASDLPNEATFSTSEDDLKYFNYLRQIAGRSKIFVYLTNDYLVIPYNCSNILKSLDRMPEDALERSLNIKEDDNPCLYFYKFKD